MSLTTDRNHPELGHGADNEPVPQNKVYLVLSEEERKKGFVRPVRTKYKHVGLKRPEFELRDLTAEEKEKYGELGWVKFEKYPPNHPSKALGKYWTQEELNLVDNGCNTVTSMAQGIAETYARNPHFYGSTYCCYCMKHRPVEEFVWDGTEERVGS